MKWITSIFGTLFGELLNWGTAWFEKERAASRDYEAKARKVQMDSVKEGIELEKKLTQVANETAPDACDSPAGWNAARISVVCLCCFALSGCIRFYVAAREYRPIIPTPERPVLSGEQQFNHEDGKALADYATKLEKVVQTYNEWAENGNKQAGFSD
jgi:hypothetical protein